MSVFGGSAGVTIVGNAALSARIADARKSLETARDYLDKAVGALPKVKGDSTMATPYLITLLVRAVAARRHLNALETIVAPSLVLDGRPRPLSPAPGLSDP